MLALKECGPSSAMLGTPSTGLIREEKKILWLVQLIHRK